MMLVNFFKARHYTLVANSFYSDVSKIFSKQGTFTLSSSEQICTLSTILTAVSQRYVLNGLILLKNKTVARMYVV